MLDAAHGEAVRTIIVPDRAYSRIEQSQVARIGTACLRRRRPIVAMRTDIRQGSRRVVAVARSRRTSNHSNEWRKGRFRNKGSIRPGRLRGSHLRCEPAPGGKASGLANIHSISRTFCQTGMYTLLNRAEIGQSFKKSFLKTGLLGRRS